MRAASRTADVSKATTSKLLDAVGPACADYQDRVLVDLPCRRLQLDEIWSFVYAKRRNLPRAVDAPPRAGDVWTWVAICADTKLVPAWQVGDRTIATGRLFIDDLRKRLRHRVQLTSDGHEAYVDPVSVAFGDEVDYAMLVKLYGYGESGEGPRCYKGAKKVAVIGEPDLDEVSTSYIERQNLTMRMSMRRFTRRTNGFSKRMERHMAAVSLHFMYYNFCRIHQTLKVTPAMEAGVSDRLWELEDVVALISN